MIGIITVEGLDSCRVLYEGPRQIRIHKGESPHGCCVNPGDLWRWWDDGPRAVRERMHWIGLDESTDGQVLEFKRQLGLAMYHQAAEALDCLDRAVVALIEKALGPAVRATARKEGCTEAEAVFRRLPAWVHALQEAGRDAVAGELHALFGRQRFSAWIWDFEVAGEGAEEHVRKRHPGKVKNRVH